MGDSDLEGHGQEASQNAISSDQEGFDIYGEEVDN